MEIAKIILGYTEVLIWPIVIIFLIFRFSDELKGFIVKALGSHEVEVDILGQKIKLKALEKLSEETPEIAAGIEDNIEPSKNALATMHLFSIISSLSTDEVFILRTIANEITSKGYNTCEAERLVVEKFVNQKIFTRDESGFYHPTNFGKRLLLSLKYL